MSLYLYSYPLENSLFDVFEDNLFNTLISRNNFGGLGCGKRRCHRNPYHFLEKELSQFFNEDNLKLVDFEPKMNLSENNTNYFIHLDLPGMTKEQIKIEINENENIENTFKNKNNKTEKEEQEEEQEKEKEQKSNKKYQENDDEKYNLIECNYGSFFKSFILPEDVNYNEIQAKMENGVLEVIINKIQNPKNQTRSIQIQ
ncbi:hypothetical protein PIROE2DRAFT_16027 [Piromyces sp. E2]|nr:hypothetical protein PIROE2DRAFT_16027 [Piromyces sp. E2]|eukprot:OUM58647.1 hypothetical protein PIROE2DRAFT_16027 [Piromyces sp. E2]